MKRLLPFLVLTLCTSLAFAEPPAPAAKVDHPAANLVNKKLVKPLQKAQAKRSRFSRSRPMPARRRVRVTDGQAQTDSRGKKFVRFAVDERRGWSKAHEWRENRIVGCAYVHEGQVFVLRGDDFLPAKSLLGKRAKPRAQVCRAAAGAATAKVAKESKKNPRS
jgi:hypothetical protein